MKIDSSTAKTPELVYTLAKPAGKDPLTIPAYHQWVVADGVMFASFHRLDSGYRIHFPALADFTVSFNGEEIVGCPIHGIASATIDHLYLNQVLPLALSRQMKLVLHGGAIEIGASALAILGLSGRGKSTLTASFATHGYRFLTDDGLQLEPIDSRYFAKPNHPSIRLWEDSEQQLAPVAEKAPPVDYTPKSRLLAGEHIPHCPDAKPLQAIYLLGDGSAEAVAIAPVSPRDAILELVRHSFLLDIEERAMLQHHFGQLTDLVRKVPVFTLDYPRDFGMLDQVRAAIIRHSQEIAGPKSVD